MAIKDAKINYILDCAINVFLERSISEVTVHDIAVSAGVGEATIYRYFSTKQNLVCAIATELQNKIFENTRLHRKARLRWRDKNNEPLT